MVTKRYKSLPAVAHGTHIKFGARFCLFTTIYEGHSINSRTAKFFVYKVKDKNCSICCSCDIYCVLHIPWVIITMSLMTSLLFSILTDNVGMQQEQQIVIKFLVAECVTNAEIYHRLAAVFKDDCLSSSRVFEWCTHFCDGRQHVTSQSPKKFKVQPSAGKIMLCVF